MTSHSETAARSARPLTKLLCAAALALGPGCTSLISPHQAYAPLLDHAGQLDVSVRAGPSVPGDVGASVNVAYAPIDHLEVVVGGDGAFAGDARHYGAHLGVGTFVRDDVLRLEAIVGVYGGVAQGEADGFFDDGASGAYRLEGPYAKPYAQFFVGFENAHFELAGGVRFFGFITDVDIVPDASSPAWRTPSSGYARMYIEPALTVRFPFDWFRIEFTTGLPVKLGGDSSPGGLAPEGNVMWYAAFGVGFQLDTVEQPAPGYEEVAVPVVEVEPLPPPDDRGGVIIYEAPRTPAPPAAYGAPPSAEGSAE